jgi:hypothetical protein
MLDYITNEKQKIRNQGDTTCTKVIIFLEKYLKPINRISLNNYKKTILKNLGKSNLTKATNL